MTGIKTTEKESYYDLPSERYNKCIQAAKKYDIIQVGICIFQKNKNTYQSFPFNAYVLQRKIKGYTPEICVESGAIKFNSSHGMNFNSWIKNGINFLSHQKHKELINKSKKQNETQFLNEINEALGFTKLLDMLSHTKLPIVGHNCYMDLVFLYKSFIGYLPFQYAQDKTKDGDEFNFKGTINQHFNEIYDTKTISNSYLRYCMPENNKSTSLENIKQFIEDNQKYQLVQVEFANGFEGYQSSNGVQNLRFHEAGFDAHLTGWVFAQLREYYIQNFFQNEHEFKQKFVNKVFIMNNRYLLSLNEVQDQKQFSDAEMFYIVRITCDQKENGQLEEIQYVIMKIFENFGNLNLKTHLIHNCYFFLHLQIPFSLDQNQKNHIQAQFDDCMNKVRQIKQCMILDEQQYQQERSSLQNRPYNNFFQQQNDYKKQNQHKQQFQ